MSKRILISNDDGINSEGLHKLHETLKKLGEVYIVAPDRDQSAVSHSLTLYRPLRLDKISEFIYTVDGTPTDCVNLAINGILRDKKPDLVVSGINKGENVGDDITYSGTVSAAMEGTLLGIPSIALSLVGRGDFNFDYALHHSLLIAKYVLENKLPEDTLLNVNIPNLPGEQIKGIVVTRQGKRLYDEPIVEKVDPRGKKYYWIGGDELGFLDIEGSDIVAVKEGYVSVTPIGLDLTNYGHIDKLRSDLLRK
ncbi:MAG: 5'/3'-nucleotidase SurE [Candidatus Dadabacteria bacterium]|nr:5'/3'-nucleotidase SurE [Candidatus Dadabacteria bacterium]